MSCCHPVDKYMFSTTAQCGGKTTTKHPPALTSVPTYCNYRNPCCCSTKLAEKGSQSLVRIGSLHRKGNVIENKVWNWYTEIEKRKANSVRN